MFVILPNILTLEQYLQLPIALLKPDACPQCGKAGLWYHCHYTRKAARLPENKALNPIPIYRFYCPCCQKTCSVLPECIPPRRWYMWCIQVQVLQQVILGRSINATSKAAKVSRRTCQRWFQRWTDSWLQHTHALRTYWRSLGQYQTFGTFWQAALKQEPFSKAMRLCHEQGVIVP